MDCLNCLSGVFMQYSVRGFCPVGVRQLVPKVSACPVPWGYQLSSAHPPVESCASLGSLRVLARAYVPHCSSLSPVVVMVHCRCTGLLPRHCVTKGRVVPKIAEARHCADVCPRRLTRGCTNQRHAMCRGVRMQPACSNRSLQLATVPSAL